MKISIKEITGNRQFCPFNIVSFEYLHGSKRGDELLDELYLLYEEISYSFSSPGNSFQRNVIYELNRPYNYGPPVEYSLFESTRHHPELRLKYEIILSELYDLLIGVKFRQVDDLLIDKMKEAPEITIASDWLTKEGIARTLDTFNNLPESLKDKMHFESVDFWAQFDSANNRR